MLNKQLQFQIDQEAETLYDLLNEKAQEVDSYDIGLPMANRQTQPIVDCLTQYAQKLQAAEEKADRYEKAQKEIRDWKLPATNRFWDHGTRLEPMSYEACYGSNGVRDYFKALATEALTPKTSTDE